MATERERLAKLEAIQDRQEQAIFDLKEKVSDVEAVAMEAQKMVGQTRELVAQIPGDVAKTIREESRSKRIELRDWLFGLAMIAGPIIAVYLSAGIKH